MTLFAGVALITGAASGQSSPSSDFLSAESVSQRKPGIGRATAISFAREGCTKIVLADLSLANLQETSSLITFASPTCSVLIKQTDISKPSEVVVLLEASIEQFGRIDYAVNAAGILGVPKRSHEMEVEEFDQMLAVNYRGCWLCSREELKYMVKQEPLESHTGRPGNRGWEQSQRMSLDVARLMWYAELS